MWRWCHTESLPSIKKASLWQAMLGMGCANRRQYAVSSERRWSPAIQTMAILLNGAIELGLETRKKKTIRNRLNRALPDDGLKMLVRRHLEEYKTGKHRPVGPCETYNCHGLTFGSRRTWIGGVEDIENILVEDEYQAVSLAAVLPGDIAIYRKEGKIDHSGIVTGIDGIKIYVLSKWGNLHEVIHPVLDCPYNDCQVSYYRIVS